MENLGGRSTGSAEQHELFPAPSTLDAKSSEEVALRLQQQPEDVEALLLLIRRHSGEVMKVCLAIVGKSMADDLVQDVWVLVKERVGQYKAESAFIAWVKAIARNAALNQRKREKLFGEIRRELTRTASRESTQPSTATSATLSELDELVRKLPETLRKIIDTRFSEDTCLTLAEVAGRLGLKKTKVVEHWKQALGILKSAMGVPSRGPSL